MRAELSARLRAGARADAGFTLLEVLVALLVSALLLGIILDAAADARRRGRMLEDKREALFLAPTLLAQGAVAPWSSVPVEGRTNGLSWRLEQRPLARDLRHLYVLALVKVSFADARGRPVFSAEVRRFKVEPQR